jgi:serine/threonine protein kinase
MPPRPGDAGLPSVPGYEVLGVLGKGGMGLVYRARQVGLDRVVALKMLRDRDADADELARFRVEAEAIARLSHPNIVQVFEVGAHDGSPN